MPINYKIRKDNLKRRIIDEFGGENKLRLCNMINMLMNYQKSDIQIGLQKYVDEL